MKARIRTAAASDWPAILQVANQAVPDAAAENLEWWENRQSFETRQRRRRHYVAQEPGTSQIVGYGAVEEGPEPGQFRVFVVMDRALLASGIADAIYARLEADLCDLGAEVAWVREEARDPVVGFFQVRGLQERARSVLANGREAIVLSRRLQS
jgi:L-amino acid N-acyltransferase YncA